MPRPVSWLQQIPRIKRTLTGSQQSDYGRRDIEALFDLRERAAAELMEMLPRTALWGAHAVKREELLRFLDQVLEADDVHALFFQLRAQRSRPSRKRPRVLVATGRLHQGLAALPAAVTLTRGRLAIDFRTVMELAEALAILGSNLSGDEDWFEFQRLYEPEQPRPSDADRGEVRRMFAELERMEAVAR
jgi:hypothetical protein